MENNRKVANLRCDCPEYIYEQIRDFTHRNRMTIMAMIANALVRAYPNDFSIALEDLVPDKRRATPRAEPEPTAPNPASALRHLSPPAGRRSRPTRRGRR
jgi:hypothetical protein